MGVKIDHPFSLLGLIPWWACARARLTPHTKSRFFVFFLFLNLTLLNKPGVNACVNTGIRFSEINDNYCSHTVIE